MNKPAILTVENLTVGTGDAGSENLLDGVSAEIFPGEIVGLVGESGCGKSLLAQAVTGLLDSPPLFVKGGRVILEGDDWLALEEKEKNRRRGRVVSMIWQDFHNAFNPLFTVGSQMIGIISHIHPERRRMASWQCCRLLERLNLDRPQEKLRQFPHQLSGGTRQRLAIATAMLTEPRLLIADEPTTALDAGSRSAVTAAMTDFVRGQDRAIVFISHDLTMASDFCHRIMVMYSGKIVETAPAGQLQRTPLHPYSKGLVSSTITFESDRGQPLSVIPSDRTGRSSGQPGCKFAARCPQAADVCRRRKPPIVKIAQERSVACWLHADRELEGHGKC
ncbi:MAG: ABC transporter ATP-binding protein [Negativicutes bacterium]|nr:ABC transporter ATP-binding protein [Negativicutes bacterium]